MSATPCPEGRSFLPYQIAGIDYMLGGRGTILGDEMGLGKTVQAIGVMNAMGAHGRVKTAIVCPAGLRLNWWAELHGWCTTLEGLPGRHPDHHRPSVRVLSYHEAAADYQSKDLLIVDEAHYIKTAHTRRSQAIQRMASRAGKVILITGTPYENSPIELWPLLRICAPEQWDPAIYREIMVSAEQRKAHPGEGYNFWRYAITYCDLKKRSIQSTSPRTGRTFYKQAYDFSGASNLTDLQTRLRQTCMVRRLKKDVLAELPAKRRQIMLVDLPRAMTDGEEHILPDLSFENYEDQIRGLVAEKVLFREWSKRRHEQGLAMVTPVLEILEETFAQDREGKRLLFCHHTDVADAYHAALTAMGIGCVMVTGQTHPADRQQAVHAFQTDAAVRVFIGSIKAAGVGLTLTAACGVDFAEQSPVPGEMSQAEDRAHRIGASLTRHLHVRIFVADRSLSARMMKIVIRKQDVIRNGLDTMAGLEPKRMTP